MPSARSREHTAPSEVPWIISVDDHVIEPPGLFQSRLPAKMRDTGPRVVRLPWERGPGFRQGMRPASSGPLTDFWQVEDIRVAIPTVEAAVGRRPEDVAADPISYTDMRPGCYRVAERLRDMDVAHIDRSLCFPNVVRFAGQLFLWLSDRELGLACVRAYNDWMVAAWAGESGGRLEPLCIVPLWDPCAAADEVRRNAARGVRAVSFTDWMFSGHLCRYPNLKLAFSESQIGWIPYMLERMDRIWRTGADTHDYLARVVEGIRDDEVYTIARGNAIRMLDLEEDLA